MVDSVNLHIPPDDCVLHDFIIMSSIVWPKIECEIVWLWWGCVIGYTQVSMHITLASYKTLVIACNVGILWYDFYCRYFPSQIQQQDSWPDLHTHQYPHRSRAIKSTFLDRVKKVLCLEDITPALTFRNYKEKFHNLLCWEEMEHISLLRERFVIQ